MLDEDVNCLMGKKYRANECGVTVTPSFREQREKGEIGPRRVDVLKSDERSKQAVWNWSERVGEYWS